MSKLIVTEKVVVRNRRIEVVKIREGPRGLKGDTGAGVAEGGLTGQVHAKRSDADYDTEYVNPYRTIVSKEQPTNLMAGDVWIEELEEE